MIEAGAHFKVEVSSEDLVRFADRLIQKAQEMRERELAAKPANEEWLTAPEAAELCKVSPATLWSWAKTGYLVPAKMGRSRRFAKSDIMDILNDRKQKAASRL